VSAVTIDTPGIERQGYCCLCGVNGIIEMHHVIRRAQGGHHGPQIPLCRECHQAHHDGRHTLEFEYVDGAWYGGERHKRLVIADPEEAA
jgi:hypothetical protein